LVKVEGTLEELRAIFMENATLKQRKEAKQADRTVALMTKPTKRKRKLSAWNKYVKNPKNHIKFKSGAKKGKLDLAKMSRAFKRRRK